MWYDVRFHDEWLRITDNLSDDTDATESVWAEFKHINMAGTNDYPTKCEFLSVSRFV